MHLFRHGLMAVAAMAAAFPARATDPIFDPSTLKHDVVGPPGEIMILGTPHISGWPESFDSTNLAPLLDRLASWRPDSIAIEALSGMQCDWMRRYPERYADTVASYCIDTSVARIATGLDVPQATAEAEKLLAAWPATPRSTDRRYLAALFLAAGDDASALVQWLRLPTVERREGDGLDKSLTAKLEKRRLQRNENFQIGARLAARLGLEPVIPMDDHSADAPVADEQAYGDAITKRWDNPATAARRKMDAQLMAGITTGDGVLALYRAYNAPDQAMLIYHSDFGAALGDPSPQYFGRNYVASWETRNLRMASNIREAAAVHPGGRTLVIVGASHKFYLQAYLGMMHDIQLAESKALLD